MGAEGLIKPHGEHCEPLRWGPVLESSLDVDARLVMEPAKATWASVLPTVDHGISNLVECLLHLFHRSLIFTYILVLKN